MADGLRAPLSPQEELTLRRVAHAALTVDPENVKRLLALALVERTRGGWRLTATGKLRHDALPKAALVKGGPSTRMTTLFIDGLLEKAMARARDFTVSSDAAAKAAALKTGLAETIAVRAMPASTIRRRETSREPALAFTLFEPSEWRVRADQRLQHVRATLDTQRKMHARQVAESQRRLELSRSTLMNSAPRWPAWWPGGPEAIC